MKECLNCRIKVGGEGEICPICQNTLIGEASPYNWPSERKLRQQAFWYKLQLFIALALAATGLILDFMLNLHGEKHWSLVVAMWVIIGEHVFNHYLHRSIILANILTMCTLYVAVLLYITGWYLGFRPLVAHVVIPIMVSSIMILNLVLAFLDKKGNALVYLLMNIFVGLVVSVIIYFLQIDAVAWTVCFIISVVTFIGVAVFFGRRMLLEIQKRLNF